MPSTLDASQLDALKRILTQEIALVQGPPGTGKTFLGLEAAKVLLKNKSKISPHAPILVVTLTNHALDQFLEGLHKFVEATPNLFPQGVHPIVRVGSRSQSEVLDQYNLRTIRMETKSRGPCPPIKEMHTISDYITENIQPKLQESELTPHDLISILDPFQLEGFLELGKSTGIKEFEDVIKFWVGSAKQPIVDEDGFELVTRKKGPSQPAGLQVDFAALSLQNMAGNDSDDDDGFEVDPDQVRERILDDEVETQGNNVGVGLGNEDPGQAWDEEAFKWTKTDPRDIPRERRPGVLRVWTEQFRSQIKDQLAVIIKKYDERATTVANLRAMEDMDIFRNSVVIGMTTTGMAKYSAVFGKLRPKIVFVEEAAEVLESHVLAALTEHTEHLILIGDHQQLRPSTAVYELAVKYHLNLSLFERLVNRGLEKSVLSSQRRMRPEISQLLKPIYPQLIDYPSVKEYENVKGVLHNLFFVTHTQPEGHLAHQEDKSKVNLHEADFVASLVKYFVKQGYKESQITALTFYLGQKFEISKRLGDMGLKEVRVSTVDNYQGEENDIVILSVVRSNAEGVLGYCAVDNRICVALSRARHGFYVIGNTETIKYSYEVNQKGKLWEKILPRFGQNQGPTLKLACQNHPRTVTEVANGKDFQRVKDGGCSLQCEDRLPCGHQCPRNCHPDGHDFPCQKQCGRELPCKHLCKLECWKECECRERVERQMPKCGHTQTMPCKTDPADWECRAPSFASLACGHRAEKKCCDPSWPSCTSKVERDLPCGHRQLAECSMPLGDVKCQSKCPVTLSCGHPCSGTCGQCELVHLPCKNKKCGRILVCSHSCTDFCSNGCPPCKEKCTNFCGHSKCRKPCGEICEPCRERCGWKCPHLECTRLCHELCDRERCNEPCQKLLKCRHPCIGLCGEVCPKVCRVCEPNHATFEIFFGDEDEPNARFIALECGHIIESKALDKFMDEQPEKGSVQFKACPRCKNPIRKILRYSNIIKTTLADVTMVKRKILQNAHAKDEARLKNKINIIREFGKARSLRQSNMVSEGLVKLRGKLDDQHLKTETLELVAEKVSVAILLGNLKGGEGRVNNVATLAQVRDLEETLQRFFQYNQRDYSKEFGSWFDEMKAQKKVLVGEDGISNEERLEILKAMDFSLGHWFKCPQGHIYAIGECGGAMEEARCNECGSKIGGRSHRLLADNAVATEMDGSRHGAYTLAQDPRNFDPAQWR